MLLSFCVVFDTRPSKIWSSYERKSGYFLSSIVPPCNFSPFVSRFHCAFPHFLSPFTCATCKQCKRFSMCLSMPIPFCNGSLSLRLFKRQRTHNAKCRPRKNGIQFVATKTICNNKMNRRESSVFCHTYSQTEYLFPFRWVLVEYISAITVCISVRASHPLVNAHIWVFERKKNVLRRQFSLFVCNNHFLCFLCLCFACTSLRDFASVAEYNAPHMMRLQLFRFRKHCAH